MRCFKFPALLFFLVLLAACGGNGSAEAPLAASASHPVAKAAVLTGGSGVAIHMYQALYGQAPSYAMLNTYSALAATDASAFARSLTNGFASTSNNALARLVLDNLGVTAVSVTALNSKGQSEYALLLDALTQMFAAYGADARGQIILNATNLLAGLESDATYGAAAAAYNNQAASNLSYSANPASTGVRPVMASAFNGNVVLGSPTGNSIRANVFSPAQSGSVWLVYGSTPGLYDARTAVSTLVATKPLEISIDDLQANTRYFYRLHFQSSSGGVDGFTTEYSFQTARPPGTAFTFAIQGDSHPERLNTQFDPDLYARTLLTAAADKPDFYILSGDDFSVDLLDPTIIDAAKVTERYTLQRPFLGLIGSSSPVFMVNGNHEQAAAYLLNGTPNNVAVWAQNARNAHYSQPAPDGFYSGNSVPVPYIGLLRNYFAWTWGDALFVTIDPYWASPVAVDNVFGGAAKRANMWDVTHGDAQYQWLKKTLEASKARYKFVFAHHVMGTGRGGIELVRLWEWGGEDGKGVSYFAQQRPSWTSPIHQLLVKNGVTIFFQGHDHIWVRQQIDGVTYQTLPEPADPNYTLWNSDAYLSGDKFPNTGYTRVSVAPSSVRVEYVRTYLPKDEGPGKVNGSTVFSYTIP